MLFRRPLTAALSGLALTIAATGPSQADDPLRVVTSFSILADMAKEIGGDAVEVTSLVGPGGDAHVFEPTPSDAKTMMGADILVINGLDFEGWLPRLVAAAEFSGTEIVASRGVTPRAWDAGEGDHDAETDADHDDHAHDDDHDHDPDHDGHDEAAHGDHHHGDFDPHAWQNLANGVIYAQNIAEALEAADPDNAALYRQRAEDYVARIEALDAEVRAAIEALPEDRRKVVTSHEAFGYFEDAYGITFLAPEGLSTDGEVSAAEIAAIISEIRAEDIGAFFIENIADNRVLEQIARETGASIGGSLFSDALSGPDGEAPTYLGMFRHNAETLTTALAAD
ncbi:metal ABC transporter substrate-binding protein [Acuticoccus sp. M5D2P5]|uniref:metal ABC transporter substrate-binding protein n=1 Tax=Acuticoccus kalidii TaxID=2910977 RepID=UPI001F1B6018|nr:metal ABC transporter substrate-binding protein [Acuticoccus kalidii]MCF3933107.1 metal ABC transporter substrate-binding protein [Acuticoccus kalidii]